MEEEPPTISIATASVPIQIPIIEVHDFHLETLPFWEHYLAERLPNYTLRYYFPIRRFMQKPNGSMGGVFQSVIPRNRMHRISELTDQMQGPLVIFNSVPLSTDKDWATFDTLTERIAPAFHGALMTFHGKHPMVLQRAEIQRVIARFRTFQPVFLHPSLRTLETSPPLSICLPLLPRLTAVSSQRNFPAPPTHRNPIRIGVIGTLWGNCRDYTMLLDTAVDTVAAQLPIEYYIIGGIPSRPEGDRAYRDIRAKAQHRRVIHMLHFYLNMGSDRFHDVVSSLDFIAPLTFSPLYETIILNGSVPLALSLGKPLLLKTRFAHNYNLVGKHTYNGHLREVLPYLSQLTPNQYQDLEKEAQQNYTQHHSYNQGEFARIVERFTLIKSS